MAYIYTIRCKPNNPNFMDHRVGHFETPEKAFAQIPVDSKSSDFEGGVTWYYTVECFKHNEVPKDISVNLPLRFPYRGL